MSSQRARFSLMMFLQYGTWGSWTVVGAAYYQGLEFSDSMMGWLFGVLWLACIVSPFFAGQIVDRYLPTQNFLAAAHLLGSGLLFSMAGEPDFTSMMVLMSLYCLLYAPTLPLTNSICFHHLNDPERNFGKIRVWGTLGWIAAAWTLTLWRSTAGQPVVGDLFYLAAAFSLTMGLYCLTLPSTPPRSEAENPMAFLEALKLLKDRNFAVFLAVSFVVTTELQFYYIPTSMFLPDIGVASQYVPAVMSIAQIGEIAAMWLLLPIFLKRYGLRVTLAIGIMAWPLRYVIFAIGQPVELVILSLALHGIGYTFFFVASQIFVNSVAKDDIRASAQGLLTLVTLGVGNFLGTMFYTFIKVRVTDGGTTDWTTLFLVPCALTAACAMAFLIFFKPVTLKSSS